MKTLGLLFLGLLTAKAVAALPAPAGLVPPRVWRVVRALLYAADLLLVIAGAWTIGNDVAAETHARVSMSDMRQGQAAKAYINAHRAVELRPATLRYWQSLSNAKFAIKQFPSTIADFKVLQSLSSGKLEESDAYRLAASHYFLGKFDRVYPLTQEMIRANRVYAAPYVLEGYAHLGDGDYAGAAKMFLVVLQMFPGHQGAVEGLAHSHYLDGNPAAALSVLDQTARFRFPPEARRRFQALKALYAQ